MDQTAAARPRVVVADLHVMDAALWGPGSGFTVDVRDYEALGLTDTTSQWFPTYEPADTFGRQVAALLMLDIERVI